MKDTKDKKAERHAGLKRAFKVIGSVVAILSLIYLLKVFFQNYDANVLTILSWQNLLPYLGIIAIFVFSHVLSALGFSFLLNQRKRFADLLEIHCKTQIGKYLPGNVFHLVGRAALAKKAGIDLKDISVATTSELVILVFTGALLGTLILGKAKFEFLQSLNSPILLVGVAGALLSIVIVFGKKAFPGLLSSVNLKNYLACFGITVFMFLAMGVILVILLALLTGHSPVGWLTLAGGHAVAWVVGFVTPGAPGGIGVREITLFKIFDGTIDQGVAAGVFLLTRLFGIISDFLTFGLGLIISKMRSSPGARPSKKAAD